MAILDDIEMTMAIKQRQHIKRCLNSVSARIGQMGYNFDTADQFQAFMESKVVFMEAFAQDIVDVWIVDNEGLTQDIHVMRLKKTPPID